MVSFFAFGHDAFAMFDEPDVLGDIADVVADALEICTGAHGSHHFAQDAGHRLAQCEQPVSGDDSVFTGQSTSNLRHDFNVTDSPSVTTLQSTSRAQFSTI